MPYRIGLDIGITSIGFAVIENDDFGDPRRVIEMNSVIFPRAEAPDTGASLAKPRRDKRGIRRNNRRKQFRKHRTKQYFLKHNLITQKEIDTAFNDSGNRTVYDIRVDALDKLISNQELFRLTYFFVGHRGFKSNRKSDKRKEANGPVLKGIKKLKNNMTAFGYRTLGELYLKDEMYKEHKRNKEGDFIATPPRELVEEEIRLIIEKQIELGNNTIPDDFLEEFLNDKNGIFSGQRDFDAGPENGPYSNPIEKMIGFCTFEEDEKSAPKASPSFERFRLLSKVNNLEIHSKTTQIEAERRPLEPLEKQKIEELAYNNKKVTFYQIRTALDIPKDSKFNLINYGSKKDHEKTEKDTKFISMDAYHEFTGEFNEMFDFYNENTIDKIAYILTIHSGDDGKRKKLKALHIPDEHIEKLLLLDFSGFGKLSLKALGKIIPFLEEGLTYDKACQQAGYDFKNKKMKNRKELLENITNPVVKRAVSMTMKVVKHITNKYGEPDTIHIELGREIGRSKEDREKITKSIEENQSRNEKLAKEIRENGFKVNGQNIRKLALWKEQNGLDPYGTRNIPYEDIFTNKYEVDHIIPYSRSFDDRFTNIVLTSSKHNQEKGNRLPYEYLKHDDTLVQQLEVVAKKIPNPRKRQALLKKKLTTEDESGWKQRNIQDTQYIAKLLHSYFDYSGNIQFNEDARFKQKVRTISGAITSRLRARWGLPKEREEGDKHHAVDAVVVACITKNLERLLTLYSYDKEIRYNKGLWDDKHKNELEKLSPVKREEFEKLFKYKFPEPWEGFRDEVFVHLSDDPKRFIDTRLNVKSRYTDEQIEKLKPMFVYRKPNRKVRGAAHKDTIRSHKLFDEGKSIERVSISDLKINSKNEIAGKGMPFYKPEDNGWKVVYEKLYKQLSDNKKDGSKAFPDGHFKYTYNGTEHIVKKVKVVKTQGTGVLLDEGKQVASNGDMVRIDVFKKEDGGKREQGYYLVPIYVHDTLKNKLPNKATKAHTPRKDWPTMKDSDFVFSLYPNDMVHIEHKRGIKAKYNVEKENQPEKIKDFYGYFVSAHSSLGQIKIRAHDSSFENGAVGIKSLINFEKMTVDYSGNYHRVNEKKRQTFTKRK